MNQIKSNIKGGSNLDCLLTSFIVPKNNSYFRLFHNRDNPKDKVMQELIEEIKSIESYEGLYEVSNYGYIISLAKTWIAGKYNIVRKKKNTILKMPLNGNGYCQVNLCKDGKIKSYKVSHLVWNIFGDQPRNGRILQVDHVDGNKQNDRIDNLQLLTQRENVSKGFKDKKTSSKYPGVYWHKKAKKWRADICINGEQKYLGLFTDETDASNKYQEALNGL